MRRLALALALALPLVGAGAEPCPDLATRIDAAWAAFDDAELLAASSELDAAIRELACQTRLIAPAELFGLFELDALVSLGNEDEDRAVYAVIRAVTADPERETDPANGVALAELAQTWRRRLAKAKVLVGVAGEPILYLDGRPIPPGSVVEIVEGEHLLQWEEAGGVHSEVRELVVPQHVLTSPVAAEALPLLEPPRPTAPSVTPPSERPPPSRRRVGRAGVWGTGLGLAALGGGSVLAGFLLERRFEDTTYVDADAVERDATLVRGLYGAGYGLLGVGGVLTTVGLAVHPRPDGVALVLTVPL